MTAHAVYREQTFMDTISPTVTGKKIEAEWVSIRDACTILSVSRPTIYKFIAEKRLDAKKLGPNKSIVSVASIRKLPETLPDVQASRAGRSPTRHRAAAAGRASSRNPSSPPSLKEPAWRLPPRRQANHSFGGGAAASFTASGMEALRVRIIGSWSESKQPTKIERLAQALLADRNRPDITRHDITACFMCGHGMLYRGSRFCSDRCRTGFDSGAPGYLQDWRQSRIVYRWRDGREMPIMGAGFRISCAHCHREFESKGLRCCSSDCEHAFKEREANLAVMAEAGIEPAAKRTCLQCGGRIPQWRKGRRVSAATRFCSEKCGQRHRKAKGTV
jgi:excisionase family DNA binding protein